MAYASLLRLEQIMKLNLDPDQDPICPHKIKSLYKNVVYLINKLDGHPDRAGAMFEARIQDAANLAECIIEYLEKCFEYTLVAGHTKNQIRKWRSLSIELQVVMEQIEALACEVGPINRAKAPILIERAKAPVPGFHASASDSGFTGKDTLTSTSYCAPTLGLRFARNGTTVGLEEDLMVVKGRLCRGSDKLQIISVIGMGGIGKTTLARCAHDDPLSVDHFDLRAWVTVSQDYCMKNILLGILQSMTLSINTIDEKSEENLLEYLYKFLKGRRYLIVMDDVWDTDAWDIVRRAFPDDCNGSRVLVTSRHLDVASYVDPLNDPHRMNLMDVDRSWNLLEKTVFGEGRCVSELEEIGRFIAETCGGLPLAIVVIGGILSKVDQIPETWELVARNVKTENGDFIEILSLSYKQLPHHLRACFLYMGALPENHEINVSKLVKLWTAEGFLKSKNVEEVGREYLEELLNRSLVSISKKKSNGQIKAIKIHDLLRDLCLRKAREEKLLLGLINFPLNQLSKIPDSHHQLRVLDGSNRQLKSFPIKIRQLHQLRYLATNFSPYTRFRVPEWLHTFRHFQTMTPFKFLQTLIILPDNFKLRRVDVHYLEPLRIWRLFQLRYLILFNFYIYDPDSKTLFTLEHLHTLAHVTSFTCSENVLRMVPNLKKLKISYLPGSLSKGGWSKYQLCNLSRFHVLEKLNLQVLPKFLKDGIPSQNFRFPALQISNITFPRALKKVSLSCCKLPWSEITLIGSLPNLEVLKLRTDACWGDVWETIDGEFCQLKTLVMEGLDLHHWETESSHFPRLEQLCLDHCLRLSEIPCCIGDVPTLKLIRLDYCSELLEKSAMSIKVEQHEYGNDDIEVHIKRSALSTLATTHPSS